MLVLPEVREFSFLDLAKIVEAEKIREITIDNARRAIAIDNRTDMHKLLVGVGMAEFLRTKSHKIILDGDKVPEIQFLVDSRRIRVHNGSGYGMPYLTHPVRFSIGEKLPWQVIASPQNPLPQVKE